VSVVTKVTSQALYKNDLWTLECKDCEFEVNLFLCLRPVKLTEERSDVTTSRLVEQLTEAVEEDVEEYRPVSRYRSPDD